MSSKVRFVVGMLFGVALFGGFTGCAFKDPCDPGSWNASECERNEEGGPTSSVVTEPEVPTVTDGNALRVIGYLYHPDGESFVPGARVFVVRTDDETVRVLDEAVSEGGYASFLLTVPEPGNYTILAGFEGILYDLMAAHEVFVFEEGVYGDFYMEEVVENASDEERVRTSEDGSYEMQEQALAYGCWCAGGFWNFHKVCCPTRLNPHCFWTWRGCD